MTAMCQRKLLFSMIAFTFSLPAEVTPSSASRRNSCNCVCGFGSTTHGAIVGGVESRQHEFPWLVAIMKDGDFHCGGTLITRKHVLTAAHCVYGYDKDQLKVLLGEHNLDSPVGEEAKVVKSTWHSQYGTINFYNDIAVMELDEAVEFTNKIRPACIPENRNKNYDGITATVSGWGRVGELQSTANAVRKVDVRILSRSDCLKTAYKPEEVYETMMCAGYPQGKKDACGGDSGGPLHIPTGKGESEVVGVVSWGEGCGRANHPGVYTKVADYLDWIENNIGSECLCPTGNSKRQRKENTGK